VNVRVITMPIETRRARVRVDNTTRGNITRDNTIKDNAGNNNARGVS
jgi:hypothetical protein